MNISKLILSLLFISFSANSQNLFPKKLKGCVTDKFCLDCGDVKANVDNELFEKLLVKLNAANNLDGLSGKVMFQVLVDSVGNGCVLSHTDVSESKLTKNIVASLNEFKGLIPAKTNEKAESRTSFNLSFNVNDGKISGKVERVDIKAFEASFDKPTNPEMRNENYEYKNENLKKYSFTIWNSKNSNLPDNRVIDLSIDKNNIVWLTEQKNLVKLIENNFIHSEQNITDDGKYFGYFAVASDDNNTKWICGSKGIYSYDNIKWTKYDSAITGIDKSIQNIIDNKKTNELFFCSNDGLAILKDKEWKLINKTNLPELPENRVCNSFRDSQNRLWISTYKGIVMIDNVNNVTEFEKSNTVLKGRSFSSATEDSDGNLYFGLYYNNKGSNMNTDEGIAVLNKNNEWKKYTIYNSGLPENYTIKVIYDKFENIIWIATNGCGITRFDPKLNTWEVYNNKNSEMPTSWIYDIEQDNNGVIYLATNQGLVKMKKN